MEEVFVFIGGKDMFVPKEGEMILFKGRGLWWREVSNGAVEEHGNAAVIDSIRVG